MTSGVEGLIARVTTGDRSALARLISLFEDRALTLGPRSEAGRPALAIGITGPPGAGKSTLVSALISHARGLGHRVGVLAVDPSSPKTGGALLGDRVRMASHVGDPEVFIRGLASRGRAGGLADVVPDATVALELWGADVIFVETVGVGQTAVDVVRAVDATALVVTTGGGDEIQAAKAGVLEVADVIVVNKADQPGASTLAASIRSMLRLHRGADPVVVSTCAADGTGVADVWAHLVRLAPPTTATVARRRERAATQRLAVAVGDEIARMVLDGRLTAGGLIDDCLAGRVPSSAVTDWIADHLTAEATNESIVELL